jgi:hypothetical protein
MTNKSKRQCFASVMRLAAANTKTPRAEWLAVDMFRLTS